MPDSGNLDSEEAFELRVPARGIRASVVTAQVEALLATLEAASDSSERAEILVEVARRLRGDLGDTSQAIDALLEAWGADPTHEPILSLLEPLVREEQRWAEVLEITRTLASSEREPARAVAYAEAMVRWLTRDVPDADLAHQWLERIRVLDSTHWQLHMLQAGVSREHGDFKRELESLDRAVLSARRIDDRARIHLMMAARYLEERTLDLASAKKHFDAAHRLLPGAMDPLRGLERIALRENDNVALADVLRKQAVADVDDEARVTILLWLAKIEEEEFRKPELAAKSLERVVGLVPAHRIALEGLERTYTASRAWPELVAVLERTALSTEDPRLRVAYLERLGAVLETKLGDAPAAITTYERLATLLSADETVLGELARLSEKVGDVRSAVKYREELAELAQDPLVRARMHVVAGQLLVALDAPAARTHFERAVAVDPSNQAAWNALLGEARAEGDVARTEHYLEQRARNTEAPRARGAAFVELAEARAKRGDVAGARRAHEEAAAADSSNEIAAVALVLVLVEEGRYAEAEPLCEVAVAAAERDKDEARVVAVRRAQANAATALGKPERALAAALAAYQVRPESSEVREALVTAAVPMRADPRVLTVRDALVVIADRPEGLSLGARAGLADVLVVTGDGARAALLYGDVLSEAPDHDGAMRGLAQHHAASGNPVAALGLKRRLARAVVDLDERFGALVEIAEAFASKASNDELAAEVYEEARALRPRDLSTLHKLLALYPKVGKWAALFDVLRSIAESDSDPVRKAKTLSTMAQIAEEQLEERGGALSLFEQALDVDPSLLTAFQSIVRILTEDREWPGLERTYKRMIARALAGGEKDAVLQLALYKQIGIVYRDRVNDSEAAIAAFQAAVRLDPKDEQAQTILRELFARSGRREGAVALTLERVLRDPLEPAPYAALFDLLVAQDARDRALCVASAIRLLGIPHAVALSLRAAHPQPPIEAIVLDLGNEGYRALLHEELDPALTEIFEVVAPAVVDLAASRRPTRDRHAYPGPALEGQDWLVKAVARSGSIFGMTPPRVYQQEHPGTALLAAATKPASLLAHPPAFAGIGSDAIAFLIGKRVFEISPPLLARALCPSLTELKALARSAARIATDQTEPGDLPLKEHLKREDVARIARAVQSSMSATGKLDVIGWSRRADVSACRAGLLLAGDLEAARAGIAVGSQSPSDLTPREKMKELVPWFLGDACAALRRRLGLALA